MADGTVHAGLLFVLVGPTAVGKNRLMKEALDQLSDLVQMPTATTRPIRADEQEGREHYFFSKAGFQDLIDSGALLEHQLVHGHKYGIIRARLEQALAAGRDQIADIDVLGASILHEAFPDKVVLIFISPPDTATLEKRIRARGDSAAEIERRLCRTPFEMQFAPMCDYLIVNDQIEPAANELLSVISAERQRRALRHFVRVAAHIRKGESTLLRSGTTADDDWRALPSTIIRRGESPQNAIRRLAAELGVGPISIVKPATSPEKQPGPETYHLSAMDTSPGMLLVYVCEVATAEAHPLAFGWTWQPVEAPSAV